MRRNSQVKADSWDPNVGLVSTVGHGGADVLSGPPAVELTLEPERNASPSDGEYRVIK